MPLRKNPDVEKPLVVHPPVAGLWTRLMAAALTVVALFAAVLMMGDANVGRPPAAESASDVGSVARWDRLRFQIIVAGLYYGALASFTWWTSHVRRRLLRWCLLGLVTLALAWVLSIESQRAMVRHVSLMAGLVIVQSLLFWVARVPRWSTAMKWSRLSASARKQAPAGRQFGTADLIAVTMAFAALLASAKGYQATFTRPEVAADLGFSDPGVSGRIYWTGAAAIWIWLPVLGLLIAKAVVAAPWWKSCSYLPLILLWGGLGATILTQLQVRLSETPAHHIPTLLGDFGTFTVLYASFFGAIALAGRCDGSLLD